MKRPWLCNSFATCLLTWLLTVSMPSQATATDNCPALAPVCKMTTTLNNGDAADVYYPNVPAAHRQYFKDAFPVIVVLQGANIDKEFYSQFGTRLALSLFVVVIPNHFRIFTTPPFFAGFFSSSSVVSNAIARVQDEDTDLTSPLYTADTNTVGLVGHSFGGVAGLYASAIDGCATIPVPPFCEGPYTRPVGLKAAVFYGTSLAIPGVTPPILGANLNTSGVAVALMHGTNDGVELLEEAKLTYPTLEGPPNARRALITIDEANHYGICNVNNPTIPLPPPVFIPPPAAEPLPTLPQNEAVARVARWTGLWLRAHLKHDPLAQWWLYQAEGSLDGVVEVCTEDLSVCQ